MNDEKKVGKIMELNTNNTLLCIRVKENQLKIISELDNSRFKRFETIKGITGEIVQFKFYDINRLAVLLKNGIVLFYELYFKSHKLINKRVINIDSEIEKVDCFDICNRKQFLVVCISSKEYSSLKKMQIYTFDISNSDIILASERDFSKYLALGDTPSFSPTNKKMRLEEYQSHQTTNTEISQNRNKYGDPNTPNSFSCVYIDHYKDAKPVIVAYQKNAPFGLFIGIFTGLKIEEIRFYSGYHTYQCHQASHFEGSYYSLGEANMMKSLKIINTNF